jgi:acetylornithine/N-succinyldiaminopimelate aminotransferase
VSTTVARTLLSAYARQDVTFVEGEGCLLVDDAGRRYLDLVAGIAVVGLGHRHPAPLAAARVQLDRLWHVSNLYSTEPQARLADLLSERFGGAQAFFCNSGAEAVEAAIKYARKATGKPGVVALHGSFHGRTLGALSATGQPAKQEPFAPLLAGVRFAEANNTASLLGTTDDSVGCILLEPVQGEGGIRPLTADFVAAARALADETGALLVLDEVQTGVGRTGTFFCFEQLGVRPDAVTLAKGLANGLPIGALLVSESSAGAFEPGDHGSTFGGNPVSCAAAAAVVETIDDELLASVKAREALVRTSFPAARGRGLLLGLDVEAPASEIVDACRARGVLVGSAGERTIRLTPPLTISEDELAHGLAVLEEVLQ